VTSAAIDRINDAIDSVEEFMAARESDPGLDAILDRLFDELEKHENRAQRRQRRVDA